MVDANDDNCALPEGCDISELKYPLHYLNELREEPIEVETRSSSSIVRVSDKVRLGHVLSMLGLTQAPPPGSTKRPTRSLTIGIELAAFLAVHHLNLRSSPVVPRLEERLRGCDMYFTVEIRDTQGSQSHGAKQFLAAMGDYQTSLQRPTPTGVVGLGRSVVAVPVSILGGVSEVPQVSCCATSRALDSPQSPLFGRTTTTNTQDAEAAAEYLSYIGVTHVGVLFVDGPYGQEYSASFRMAALRRNILVVSAPFDANDPETLLDALGRLKVSNYRYFFGVVFQEHVFDVMGAAHTSGLAGSGYTWFLGEGSSSLVNSMVSIDAQERASAVAAINGTGIVLPSIPPSWSFDEVIARFREDEELQQSFIKSHVQEEILDDFDFESIGSSYFAQLNYDASIAFGLAACSAQGEFPTGSEIREALAEVEFDGASGYVSFDPETATRKAVGVQFSVYNIRAKTPDLQGQVHFRGEKAAVVDFLGADVVTELQPFLYADGTPNHPPSLPEVDMDLRLVPSLLLLVGCTFCAMMIMVCVYALLWAWKFRNKAAVRYAQPEFLLMLCVGTLLISSSIIPMSFQEPHPKSTLDVCCTLIPWLLSTGFTTAYAALFSKLWRINTIHRASALFQRRAFRVREALVPFAVLFSCNVSILVGWTVVSPLEWIRQDGQSLDRFGRATESFGFCRSQDEIFEGIFLSLLAFVNGISLLVALYQSYLARKLPYKLSEGKNIFVSMVSLLEVCILGLPILWVASENPAASYVVRCLLIFILCCAIMFPSFSILMDSHRSRKSLRAARLPVNGSALRAFACDAGWDEDVVRTGSRRSRGTLG